jgi:hypothetical protein
MPLSFRGYVSHFAKRSLIRVGDENIRSALNQSFNYAQHLFARLAGAKNDLGKTLSSGARMVHARVSDIFVMKILYTFGSRCGIQFTLSVGCQ